MSNQATELAIKFHETYERLAPLCGYTTRSETRAFDPDSPNGKTMIATCQEIIDSWNTHSEEATQEQSGPYFYIHDTTRGYVGNSMVWWGQNHRGYTCDIRYAHLFTEQEALERVKDACDLVMYPAHYIQGQVAHHVDSQNVDRKMGRKE